MNTTKKNINEIKSIVKRMPKTINETLQFEVDDEMENYDDIDGAETEEPEPEAAVNPSENAAKLIDDIRKKALRAMAELADTPEDENYIMLKKVWQMTDRKPEQASQGGKQVIQGQNDMMQN